MVGVPESGMNRPTDKPHADGVGKANRHPRSANKPLGGEGREEEGPHKPVPEVGENRRR
jgi:hypothetical protein